MCAQGKNGTTFNSYLCCYNIEYMVAGYDNNFSKYQFTVKIQLRKKFNVRNTIEMVTCMLVRTKTTDIDDLMNNDESLKFIEVEMRKTFYN